MRWNDVGAVANATAHNYLKVIATMTSTTWNTAATHEVFTVTGCVRMRMWVRCATTLEDAANAAIIQFGHEAATNAIIAATDAAGRNGTTITAGQMWYDTSPATQIDASASAIMDYVIPNGQDVGYEITGAALTGGVLHFHCVWEPLDPGATVTAGDGSALV